MDRVKLDDNGVHFENYAIIPASVYVDGSIAWSDIKEADPDAWPPELRLLSGETLFISALQKEAFAVACIRHKVPLVRRDDVWGLLLEPFLDTEFSRQDQARTQERLTKNGFSHQEIDDIRAKVERRMLLYNSIVWEWVHLGLLDLFSAHGLSKKNSLLPIIGRFRKKKQQDFYRWANEIANRGS